VNLPVKRQKNMCRTKEWGDLTALVLLLCLFLTGCGRGEAEFLLTGTAEATPTAVETTETAVSEEGAAEEPEEQPQPESTTIFVDVCGAVAHPGVYELESGSRVFQAIEAAGGFLPEAAARRINQAQSLVDGEQLYVFTEQEAEELDASGESADQVLTGQDFSAKAQESGGESSSNGKVNLNTADEATLMTLNGIGESRAKDIISYREAHGGFSAIEEIMNVQGIKEGTFNKIKDDIAVE
jgi:competence protein ComEA